jgi:pSer/pThr/pTyr-binding forkhead associated (FHA) protein
MAATIRLTVLAGPHKGTRFCTRGLNACLVGRSAECHVRFCGAACDQSTSRFHCQLILDPPLVYVQDMDRSNDTDINGQKVGESQEPEAAADVARDGDIITVGGTSMLVNVLDCSEPFAESCDARGFVALTAIVKKDCPIDCSQESETIPLHF